MRIDAPLQSGKVGLDPPYTMTLTWKIVLTPTAKKRLAAVKDHRIREKIGERIEHLANNPEK